MTVLPLRAHDRPQAAPAGLRVALFSGNYNYVRDGANRSLNRLVAYLESRGVPVRVYSPTVAEPAFEPAGTLISVPSVPVPGRAEYRVALGLPARVRADLDAFAPTLIHLSAPDWLGYDALRYAERRGLPAVASFHTRFETYLRYYGLQILETAALRYLRHFYRRCAFVLAPSTSMADEIGAARLSSHVRIWGRGVDRALFNPGRRDMAWRRSLGLADTDVILSFVGRLVKEKGLDQFAAISATLAAQGVAHRLLVIGDGPERASMASQLPDAVFAGFLSNEALARAYASADIFINPSVTETFGNVTLEAMASGLPTIGADATGTRSLVLPDVTGYLVDPPRTDLYARHARELIEDADRRRSFGAASVAASANYEWDRILASVLDTYADALSGAASGGSGQR